MGSVGVAALCASLILFVVSGTLLSAAAGLPRFAIIASETGPNGPTAGDGLGSYDGYGGWSGVRIGAFSALYLDDGSTYWSHIDSSCGVQWEGGFSDGLFRSLSACTQFQAFRSLLIIAVVFDFLLALALYTAILLRWLSPSAAEGARTVPYLGLALSLICAVPVAANAASIALMVRLVFDSFVGATMYGDSFKLMAAAFPLCTIASALLAVNCAYHHYACARVRKQPALPADVTVTGSRENAHEEGISMAAIKGEPVTHLTGIQTAA